MGFPGDSDSKGSACHAGDVGSSPGLGRHLGEGNGNPFQYSCLKYSMDRGDWWAIVHGVAKSQTQLSNQYFDFHSQASLQFNVKTFYKPISYLPHISK